MSDARLRQAQRCDPDGPAFLAERIRAGRLDPARLELAAYCGHGPAKVVLGREATYWMVVGTIRHADVSPDGTVLSFNRWYPGLAHWGVLVVTRAAAASAWWWAEKMQRDLPEAMRARRVVDAVEVWLAHPEDEYRRVEAARALLAARPVERGLELAWLPTVPNRFHAGTHPTREGGGWGVEPAGISPSTADALEWNLRAIKLAHSRNGGGIIREVISRSLIRWALE